MQSMEKISGKSRNDISVDNSRMAFRIKTEIVKEIPDNFENKYRVKGTENESLICPECHCLVYPAWMEVWAWFVKNK